MKFLTLALLVLIVAVSAQQREVKIVLDSFRDESPLLQVDTNQGPVNGQTGPKTVFGLVSGNTIVGGQRDAELTVTAAAANTGVISVTVDNGAWATSTPDSDSGFSRLQYDGVDTSMTLQTNGLNNYDLTQNLAESFILDVNSDIASQLTVTVYQGGKTCSRSVDIPSTPGAAPKPYILDYSSFNNNCDFTKVGAIEVRVEAFPAVDIIVTRFATYGLVPTTPSRSPTSTRTPSGVASASRTRTPSPAPSGTRTPSPIPSQSRTPSPTPTPSSVPSVAVCQCNCPAFRCGVVFKVVDDDDDTIDDDTHDDDDLVYRPVYYGPVDDDFDALTGDDDENEFISFQGGLTLTGINDDDDNIPVMDAENGSGVLTVSLAALVATLLLVL